MRHSFSLALSVLIAFGLLVSLGTWQVKRLAWKNELIERLHARIEKKPLPFHKALDRQEFIKKDLEYLPVSLRGIFHHGTEKHFYSLDKRGRPGWNIYTVLEIGESSCAACLNRQKYVYINRGFVPFELKEAHYRLKGQVKGEVELVGLIRFPRHQKSAFEADNQPLKNEWYWSSLAEMSTPDAGLSDEVVVHLAPVFVDERTSSKPYDWPRPGTTRIKLPNNHLGYIITWYGLALALLTVYGFFLQGKRQNGNRQKSIEDKK